MELPGVATPKARQASLREHNLALVARSVFGSPEPLSRAAVALATGLTRATVGSLVDQLVAGRVVAELAPAPGQVGRPAVPLVPASRTVVGLGLEVNVDYVGVRALDLSGATVAERIEGAPGAAPADFSGSDPVRVLARLGDLARDVVAEVEADGMQVAGTRLALPGLVDARAGFLQVAPNLGWESLAPVPLLGLLPASVEIANEANLAGLAQLPFGQFASSGHDGTTFVHVSGDVGIGAAIVLDGELYLGRHGWAGEIGHVVVDPAGPRCRCGATGCLEQLAGKDAILRGLGLEASVAARPDGAASGDLTPVLEALAGGGEPGERARAVVGRAGKALGTALSTLVNLLDLDTVFLGGVYATLAEDLRPQLEAELRTRVLASPWERIVVRPAPVSGYAALMGGARAVLRDLVQAPSDFLETLERL
ncbi:ROK family protein [Luteimicrobium xylanilyticum]|uniref:Xylose repressor n=1 Tax=Luteimicrobium xylanilyticum TaxID=1133546 RepID=A0A5P9QE32_9MICO|nr:ROK family protein [Luteimicrobium xylanilyticum]QFU99721.1 Xylose repressor [Luteimicrobium xylanilyticum]